MSTGARRTELDGVRGTARGLLAVSLLLAAGSGAALWRPGMLTHGASLLLSTTIALVAVVVALHIHRLSRREATLALALAFAIFAAWYVLWQPYHGPGSDNAEALEIGVRQLVAGEDPWAAETRLGNPLSPMLGGYILAAPFVLLTGSVYAQQLVWMALLLAALWRWASPHAALVVCLLFTASAHTRLMVPNQADNWIVAVAVLLTAWWGWNALRDSGAVAWWASSVLFGVALSYRFILWVAVIPLAVWFVREFGWARAARWMSVSGFVTVALSLGPLLVLPDTYLAGPVAMARNKVESDSLPYAAAIVAVATLAALLWGSARVRSWADVWMTTAVALAAMVGALAVTRLPGGAVASVASYETVAYNGTFLILGLVALTTGERRASATSCPP